MFTQLVRKTQVTTPTARLFDSSAQWSRRRDRRTRRRSAFAALAA